MSSAKRALLVIDVQNDYFPGGKFPLCNTAVTLAKIEAAIAAAQAGDVAVILVQHLAGDGEGTAPFLNAGTPGAQIHPRILAAAPNAPVVTKTHADAFVRTTLEATLQAQGIGELLVCGMMTQNCVTHTAISRAAEKYVVSVVADCCTTVSPILHTIALRAVDTRLALVDADAVLPRARQRSMAGSDE